MSGTTVTKAREYFDVMAGAFAKIDAGAIDQYAEVLFGAWKDGRTVFIFGNGGSAYNASHHVADYVKTAAVEGQPRLKAMSLSDNMGMLTAIGNDLSYDQTFSYPLESYAARGDVAVGISCSGNSPNLMRACEWAKKSGLTVVALTGFSGGKVKDLAHLHINVPSENYGVIEDLHMSVGHIAAQIMQGKIMSHAEAGGGR
ncbi:MAG: SIS domain-containing protein [Phycisphaerales bacterium]|nr:SIS domain-containing protein [Phycisphaerales bacterium]